MMLSFLRKLVALSRPEVVRSHPELVSGSRQIHKQQTPYTTFGKILKQVQDDLGLLTPDDFGLHAYVDTTVKAMVITIRSVILLLLITTSTILANTEAANPKKMVWPFDGIFGKVDRQAAQRGFQVYKEVCSACHGLYNLTYRNLKDIGFSEEEIKEIAKNYTVKAEPNEQGEILDRPALPSDKFVKPYPNEQAARAANNGAYPPDLSLIIKAREDGANYLYSLLIGYEEAPQDFKLMPGLYYNKYFPGQQIGMPEPLHENLITYIDGTPSSKEQMVRDITIFLQWAAEPEMEHRKSMGLKVMIFLVIFTIFFYLAKVRIWQKI